MHGLIFETSVWLLAESTRLLSSSQHPVGKGRVEAGRGSAVQCSTHEHLLNKSTNSTTNSTDYAWVNWWEHQQPNAIFRSKQETENQTNWKLNGNRIRSKSETNNTHLHRQDTVNIYESCYSDLWWLATLLALHRNNPISTHFHCSKSQITNSSCAPTATRTQNTNTTDVPTANATASASTSASCVRLQVTPSTAKEHSCRNRTHHYTDSITTWANELESKWEQETTSPCRMIVKTATHYATINQHHRQNRSLCKTTKWPKQKAKWYPCTTTDTAPNNSSETNSAMFHQTLIAEWEW